MHSGKLPRSDETRLGDTHGQDSGQEVVTEDVLTLLTELTSIEPVWVDEELIAGCFYCEGYRYETGRSFSHAPECPWRRARILLGLPDRVE
jgi:hypothetical protein